MKKDDFNVLIELIKIMIRNRAALSSTAMFDEEKELIDNLRDRLVVGE